MTIAPPRPADTERLDALDLTLQLVAAAFRTPSPELRHDLATGAFEGTVRALAEEAGVAAPALGAPTWSVLQSAHVALFVSALGGIAAPPYVGFAADDELLGVTAEALADLYRRHGITIDPHWSDLPDHVAAVAEAGLLLLEADRADAARTLVARYLFPWFERYATVVASADVSGFYGPLAGFLRIAMSEVARDDAA